MYKATNGVSTDFDGKYQLTNVKGDAIISSYIGYKNFVVTTLLKKIVECFLEEDQNQRKK
jgi:iron complex outermembrane receptor protein